jgi:hypothetical protein
MAAKKVSREPAGARSSGLIDMFFWVIFSDYPMGDTASSRNWLRELMHNASRMVWRGGMRDKVYTPEMMQAALALRAHSRNMQFLLGSVHHFHISVSTDSKTAVACSNSAAS